MDSALAWKKKLRTNNTKCHLNPINNFDNVAYETIILRLFHAINALLTFRTRSRWKVSFESNTNIKLLN
jgi:hypothetical protein